MSSFIFPIISFFIYAVFILQSISTTSSNPADAFVVRLIHRDSPLSPLYNPSMTILDRIQAAAYRSIERHKNLQSLATTTTTTSSSANDEITSTLVSDNSEYIATFYVGTPPTQVHAFIDTGSEINWLECSPTSTNFNPEKSSSYTHFSCDSISCDALAERRICQGNHEPCSYMIKYADDSITRGILSMDKFAFEDTERKLVDIGNVDFGCSDYSSHHFVGNQTGALGLNRGTLSFVSQLDIKRFAYCMAPPDSEGSGSVMYFNSPSVISGGQTQYLERRDDRYFVNLTSISIGDQNVPLPDGVFDMTSDGEGGFLIDSGTTYTILRSEAFDALIKELSEAMHLPQTRHGLFELCFMGSSDDLDSAGPDVTFTFDGSAVVMLTKQTTYIQVEPGVWCLAMMSSDSSTGSTLSILGNIQQQNYLVGFDLDEQVVSFAPVDCATF